MRRILIVPVLGAAIALMAGPLWAQDGAALFTDNCAPCHNIGEAGGAGPDLKDVARRHDRAWLLAFVLDPPSKNKAATMPPADLTRDAVAVVLDYIDRRSGAPAAAPAPPPEPVFTAEDVGQGRELFTGSQRFANGGPACFTCHDAETGGNLGGGTLGPGLARLATRLNGPKGTASWLSSPRTPVMRSVFDDAPLTPPEVHALTAFFVDRVRPEAPGPSPRTRRFVALSCAGAVAVLVLIGAAWRDRLVPVRRGLVDRAAGARGRAGAATHTQGFRSGGRR